MNVLFKNTSEDTIANQIIKQAKKVDIGVDDLQLMAIMYFLEGYSLTKYSKSLVNYQKYFVQGQMAIYLPRIYEYYRNSIGDIKDLISYAYFKNDELVFAPIEKLDKVNCTEDNANQVLQDLRLTIYQLLFWGQANYVIAKDIRGSSKDISYAKDFIDQMPQINPEHINNLAKENLKDIQTEGLSSF